MEPTDHGVTAREVAARARRAGAHPHVLDGRTLTSKDAVLDAFAARLSFPDWFGRNLDALHDCLTDLSWLPPGEHVLVWSHPHVLREHDPAAYEAVSAVLRDATATGPGPGRRLRVVLTDV